MTFFGVVVVILLPIAIFIGLYLLAGVKAAKWINKKTYGFRYDYYYKPRRIDYSDPRRRTGYYNNPRMRTPGGMTALMFFWPVMIPYTLWVHRKVRDWKKVWGLED